MLKLRTPIDLLGDALYNLVDHELKKHIHPTIKLDKVTDLDLKLVKRLKSKYGIGGIILDVDETIRKDLKEIPQINQQWVEFMKQEFKVIILSNGYSKDIQEFTKRTGIEYMSRAHKPKQEYFLAATDKIGLEPENVLVIGDDIICDIYGGNKCGMITAIVNEVVESNIVICENER